LWPSSVPCGALFFFSSRRQHTTSYGDWSSDVCSSELKDRTVLQAARTAGRVLLTLDKGIASLLQHPVHEHAGVVLFGPDTAGRQIGRASWRERGQTAAGKGLAKYVDLWLRCAHGSSLH